MLPALTAYVVIPLYTVLFACGSHWLDTNFSVLGSQPGREEAFVLWGLIVGIFFFWSLRRIIGGVPRRPRFCFLVPLALLLLVFAVTTPYLPERLPLKSFLHILFAFLAAVCLGGILLSVVLTLYRGDRRGYRRYLQFLLASFAVCAWLFLLAGIVSSALEILFTISMTLLTYRLYRKLA